MLGTVPIGGGVSSPDSDLRLAASMPTQSNLPYSCRTASTVVEVEPHAESSLVRGCPATTQAYSPAMRHRSSRRVVSPQRSTPQQRQRSPAARSPIGAAVSTCGHSVWLPPKPRHPPPDLAPAPPPPSPRVLREQHQCSTAAAGVGDKAQVMPVPRVLMPVSAVATPCRNLSAKTSPSQTQSQLSSTIASSRKEASELERCSPGGGRCGIANCGGARPEMRSKFPSISPERASELGLLLRKADAYFSVDKAGSTA